MAKLPLPISSSTMNIPTDLSAVLRLEGAGCCVAMVVVPALQGQRPGCSSTAAARITESDGEATTRLVGSACTRSSWARRWRVEEGGRGKEDEGLVLVLVPRAAGSQASLRMIGNLEGRLDSGNEMDISKGEVEGGLDGIVGGGRSRQGCRRRRGGGNE
jgi:hypothetical protein